MTYREGVVELQIRGFPMLVYVERNGYVRRLMPGARILNAMVVEMALEGREVVPEGEEAP